MIDTQRNFCFLAKEPKDLYCPSIDRLLSSLGQIHGSGAVGVLLSGMGSDGVQGLRVIQAHGGKTLVQDEQTSLIFGMPGAAIAAGVADNILSVDLIGPALIRICETKTRA